MMRNCLVALLAAAWLPVCLVLGGLVAQSLGADDVRSDAPRSGIDASTFDESVRVQDDLYLHVNGEWLKHTPIPEDKSNFGTIIQLSDVAQENLRGLIEAAAAGDHAAGSDEQKVGDFFTSYMNEEAIAARGIDPLRDELAHIDALESKEDVVRHFGHLQQLGVRTPIGMFVDQDDKNSSQYLVALIQSGTTLPDRDYYLDLEDSKYQQARKAFLAYIERIGELAELDGGAEAARKILDLETKLAEVQWERTELRDAEKRYNKFPVAELAESAGELPWPTFFTAAGVDDVEHVNAMTPSFFVGLAEVLEETPLDVWKQYLRFHLLDAYAPYLTEPFVKAHFELHQKELAGVPEQKPRWKRAVDATAGAGAGDFGVLGDAVGRLYVAKYFPPTAKAEMDELVDNLLRAFGESIDELTWMTPATKTRAREKLSKITTKIGYPTKWRDYSDLEISADDLVGNMQRAARHEYRRMLNKLGKPVDREEWGMTPQTVNAYYNPGLNEIVFPAAILQPPIFDPTVDAALNYGGIGAVIGHEISHAFDDQGSKYDGDGNLNNWWTDEDRAAFHALTQQLISQYGGYEPLPGRRINGQLTLGENIADLSGLAIAHKAYRLSLGDKPSPVIEDWNGDQRFFLGWAQLWRRKYRDAEMLRRLLTDPHSPSRYRANGPVANIDAFYQAFGVKEGDGMFRPQDERIRIW